MRDYVLVAFFVGLLPMAVRHTWIGVLLWTWVSIMNPHKLAWSFAVNMPFAMAAAVAVFISLIVDHKSWRIPRDPVVVVLALFTFWMCVTTLTAINAEASQVQLIKVLKIQLMTLVAFAAIRERRHIEWFILIMVISIGFYGVKGGIFTITSGGGERVWGPDGGFIGGNNEIGLAMVTTIPLMYCLRLVAKKAWQRHALLAMMVLSAIATLGTQSRGALVAISAMGLMLWIRSTRKFGSAIGLALVVTLLLAVMPQSWDERMSTITTYNEDSSAMGRINAWRMTVNLANDRPLVGGGFEIYDDSVFAVYAPDAIARAAHSIYFQVLGEHGYVGLILFVLVHLLAYTSCGRLRRQTRDRPEVAWVHQFAGMFQVALVGYLVGGMFLSLAYFDLPYNLMVLIVACKYWLAEQGQASGARHMLPGRPEAMPPGQAWGRY